MNSIIEAQETFLEFCQWNWKSDKFVRMHRYRVYACGPFDVARERKEDEHNEKLNTQNRLERHTKLLDEQRK